MQSQLSCPVSLFQHNVSLSKLNFSSDLYIFRPIYGHKGIVKFIYKDEKKSYTTANVVSSNPVQRRCTRYNIEHVLKRLKLVEPSLNLGLYYLRAGGASADARSNVNERCIKRHGRWKSDVGNGGNIEDSFAKTLSVYQDLGL